MAKALKKIASIRELLALLPVFTTEGRQGVLVDPSGKGTETHAVRLAVDDVRGNFQFFVFGSFVEALAFERGYVHNADGDQCAVAGKLPDGRGAVVALDGDAPDEWMLFDMEGDEDSPIETLS